MNARTAVDLFAGRIKPGTYPNTEAGCDDAVRALEALVPRLAQLEKVAELAQAYWSHQGWDEWNALGLALTDLDDTP